jgi:uncharacterized membrane protein YedE/YeeE
MKQVACAFALGLVFGAGLVISGMSDPAKVIGFLDLTGAWDPTLAFVMAGAVTVFGAAYRLALRRAKPVLAGDFSVPDRKEIDPPLVGGATIFGVGWGLSGFCPGPAVVSAGFGDPRVWVFVAAMVAGILVFRFVLRRTPA